MTLNLGPTIGWHVAPSSARASIRRHGLDWQRGAEHGLINVTVAGNISTVLRANYVFAEQAATATVAALLPVATDAWRVDLSGLALRRDPDVPRDWSGGASWYCYDAIAPERLQLVVLVHRPIGRNDPCPCGSGRKLKRCGCGMLA